jgi:hypothetical protein
VLDELVHLRAVDPYGDTIFNWLQVKRLLDDVRRAASVAPGDPAVDQLIDELEKGCADVLDYHWYVHVIGD